MTCKLLLTALAAWSCAMAAPPAAAMDVQKVTFASAQRAGPDAPAPAELVGHLARPAGAGPFPALVALHGCGGLSERFKQEMTDRYTAWGYVVLVVDSFALHPVKFACGASRAQSRADDRPWDALGAVQYLAGLGFVDASRIGLIGSSQGSWAALETVLHRDAPMAANATARPSAVVAYYPDCRAHFDVFDVPTLILSGGLDDWNPAARCQEMMARRAGRGAPVELVVYPEARHGFDWIDLRPGRRVAGYLMEYHEQSAQDSMERHRRFLERHLAPGRR